jgi:pectate lyase
MLTDGMRLTPDHIRREGYYARDNFEPWPAGPLFLWAYTKAWRLTGDRFLRDIAASIARGCGLGEVGVDDADAPRLNDDIGSSDPLLLLALLEFFRTTATQNTVMPPAASAITFLPSASTRRAASSPRAGSDATPP